jgi:hypothetical protein
MERSTGSVTRRIRFPGIFIVNLQGDPSNPKIAGAPIEPHGIGHPGEAVNSTPKSSKLKRGFPQWLSPYRNGNEIELPPTIPLGLTESVYGDRQIRVSKGELDHVPEPWCG